MASVEYDGGELDALYREECYAAFDYTIDDYLAGECSFEEAISRYLQVAEYILADLMQGPPVQP